MEFSIKHHLPERQRTPCLVVPIFSSSNLAFSSSQLSETTKKLDQASEGYITQILQRGDCDGALGHSLLLHNVPGIQAERILLVGCGPKGKLTEAEFNRLIAQIYTELSSTAATKVAIFIEEFAVCERELPWTLRMGTQQLKEANTPPLCLKKVKQPKRRPIRQIYWMIESKTKKKLLDAAIAQGAAIASGVGVVKELANTPANVCTPTFLANEAKKLAKTHDAMSASILDEKEMKALGMGLMLSVTAGSETPAKFITLSYRGTKKSTPPIVFVGKGITFDTGGNSLKTPPGMVGMKFDMCGAATIFGLFKALSQLELPINVIGVIASCENMPGPNATRPDDVVTSLSGLTVEILNTDAEGRLVLADALTYCERFKPDVVIDIATLTGACVVALGPYASGLMANDEELAADLLKAGFESTDRAWQLPLWPEYQDALKSKIADLSNIPAVDVGGKTIVAASFLAKFTEKYKWAHLDVANTASNCTGGNRGASGRPLPLLMHYLLDRCEAH